MPVLRSYLLDDEDVAELVEDRGFSQVLPADQAGSMPRACFVVSQSGGLASGSDLPLDRVRVDVRSYGATHAEARAVAIAIHAALKRLARQVVEGVLLHAATDSGGYASLVDTLPGTQGGGWPLVFRPYLVLYDERVIA